MTTPGELESLERIVLPGVGSARATMDFLDESGCGGALNECVRDGAVPFLGICVGLQVLFEHSEEGDVKCLGWLPGQVRRFTGDLRVPQIGWNEVSVRVEDAWFEGWDKRYCYFVNSYHAVSERPRWRRRRTTAATSPPRSRWQHHRDAVPHREERPARTRTPAAVGDVLTKRLIACFDVIDGRVTKAQPVRGQHRCRSRR